MGYGEIRGSDIEAFDGPAVSVQPQLPRRIDLDPEKVERGLTQLVLSLVELVRRLLEKQALRRIEGGSLSTEQVERLGTTLMRLEEQMEVLKTHFEIESLDIDLGPLGNLFDESGRGGESDGTDETTSDARDEHQQPRRHPRARPRQGDRHRG